MYKATSNQTRILKANLSKYNIQKLMITSLQDQSQPQSYNQTINSNMTLITKETAIINNLQSGNNLSKEHKIIMILILNSSFSIYLLTLSHVAFNNRSDHSLNLNFRIIYLKLIKTIICKSLIKFNNPNNKLTLRYSHNTNSHHLKPFSL
jgi:hypothetical protein